MSVSFYSARPATSEDCSICLQSLDASSITHDKLHFFHRPCIEPWVVQQPCCPYCKVLVDPNSALSFKYRVIKYCSDDSLLVNIPTGIMMGISFAFMISPECAVNTHSLKIILIPHLALIGSIIAKECFDIDRDVNALIVSLFITTLCIIN